MAWLRWYAQRGIIWDEYETGAPSDAEKPDFRGKSGTGDSARPVCLASRVRRNTAATGE